MAAMFNGGIRRMSGTFEIKLDGCGTASQWRKIENWLENDDNTNVSGEYGHSFSGTLAEPLLRVWFTDEKTAIFTKLSWG
jgi:hypothetical protein